MVSLRSSPRAVVVRLNTPVIGHRFERAVECYIRCLQELSWETMVESWDLYGCVGTEICSTEGPFIKGYMIFDTIDRAAGAINQILLRSNLDSKYVRRIRGKPDIYKHVLTVQSESIPFTPEDWDTICRQKESISILPGRIDQWLPMGEDLNVARYGVAYIAFSTRHNAENALRILKHYYICHL